MGLDRRGDVTFSPVSLDGTHDDVERASSESRRRTHANFGSILNEIKKGHE